MNNFDIEIIEKQIEIIKENLEKIEAELKSNNYIKIINIAINEGYINRKKGKELIEELLEDYNKKLKGGLKNV